MLGGIGYALVSAIEEAVFFHSVVRYAPVDFQPGNNALTEHYSMLGPEVEADLEGEPLGRRNQPLIERLLQNDAVVIAGEAKSHCVAWTIEDLLSDPNVQERGLAEKVYLLEDCTSSVVVPGSVDYTDEADAHFARFAESGAHVVRPTSRCPTGRASSASRSRPARDELEPRVRAVAAPTFADGRPSVMTMSAVKSFWPRISDEPIPYASTGTSRARTPRSCRP